MITADEVLKYMNAKTLEVIGGVNATEQDLKTALFCIADFDIENGRVNWEQPDVLSLDWPDLTDIPFKFGDFRNETFALTSNVRDFSFLPYRMGRLVLYNCTILGRSPVPYDYRFILISHVLDIQLTQPVFDNDKLFDILMGGRLDGEMPSELIPGKFKELRELSCQ